MVEIYYFIVPQHVFCILMSLGAQASDNKNRS